MIMKQENSYYVHEEQQLLEFLLKNVHGQSRNSIKHLLSRKQVLVDGRPQTHFDFVLTPGARVTLAPQPKGPALPFPLLYEDETLLAVNKPAGLLSVATEREKRRTAYRMTSDFYCGRDPKAHLFVVHRLDRDTSGVLLFAKTNDQKLALQDNWNDLVTRRGYWAVVEGTDLPDSGVCRSVLKENKIHRVYSASARARDHKREMEEGKEAVTRYQVLARRKGYSLLDVSLETGRKNQIRAQLSELGYPLAGDDKYGAGSNPMNRLALHAYALELKNPLNRQTLSITAPAPNGFKKMFPGFFKD